MYCISIGFSLYTFGKEFVFVAIVIATTSRADHPHLADFLKRRDRRLQIGTVEPGL